MIQTLIKRRKIGNSSSRFFLCGMYRHSLLAGEYTPGCSLTFVSLVLPDQKRRAQGLPVTCLAYIFHVQQHC